MKMNKQSKIQRDTYISQIYLLTSNNLIIFEISYFKIMAMPSSVGRKCRPDV